MTRPVIVLLDIGNSGVKLARLRDEQLEFLGRLSKVEELAACFPKIPPETQWVAASVAQARADEIDDYLRRHRPTDSLTFIQSSHLDIPTVLPQPQRVGIDRLLLGLVALAQLKAQQASIVIDAGTAITVDLVRQPEGFLGGNILPGFQTSRMALFQNTAALPPPSDAVVQAVTHAWATHTSAAIDSGTFWGCVGGVKELVSQIQARQPIAHILVTGGDGPLLIPHLDATRTHFHPHLVLEGIRLAWQSQRK